MAGVEGVFQLLDSRSFSSIWYWLILTVSWTWTTRSILGVPAELVQRVRRQPDALADAPSGDALLLLDWLTLNLPRWRVAPRDGAILLGLAAFVLTSLAIMGFGYGMELAQALFLLAAPFGILALLRIRLARRLWPLVAQAHDGTVEPGRAAALASRAMGRHRIGVAALSVLAVALTAAWGVLWVAVHPHGL